MKVCVLEITVAGTLTHRQKFAFSSLTQDAVATGTTFKVGRNVREYAKNTKVCASVGV
jgi:hypothetical protein